MARWHGADKHGHKNNRASAEVKEVIQLEFKREMFPKPVSILQHPVNKESSRLNSLL